MQKKNEHLNSIKCKAVVDVMDQLLDRGGDGSGGTLKLVLQQTKSFKGLNALASEAQKRFIGSIPKTPPKGENKTYIVAAV